MTSNNIHTRTQTMSSLSHNHMFSVNPGWLSGLEREMGVGEEKTRGKQPGMKY